MEHTINQRFADFLHSKKINYAEFARRAGMERQTVSNIAEGKTKDPKADFFTGVARAFPELNLRWLILGENPILIVRERGLDMVSDSEEPGKYEKRNKEVERLIETVHKLTLMMNDVPALREELERLKREVEELKKERKA